MKCKQLWHLHAHSSALREKQLSASPDLIRVDALFSFISLGTERLVASGQVPVSAFAKMQVPYMEGSFQLPIQYGYSLVGQINQPDHKWHEKQVHLMHPHQDICLVAPEALTLLPASLDPKTACLASNMETAVNAIWDGKLSAGDRVFIVGFGNIGALCGLLAAQFPGVKVVIAERNEARLAKAKALGFDLWEGGRKEVFDLSINTSGRSEGLQLAIDQLGMEGRAIELSWYGTRTTELSLGDSFHYLRKRIISSQVGIIPTSKQARWNYRRRKQLVFELLQNPVFSEVLTHEIAFDESPAFFELIRNQLPVGLGYCIRYKK